MRARRCKDFRKVGLSWSAVCLVRCAASIGYATVSVKTCKPPSDVYRGFVCLLINMYLGTGHTYGLQSQLGTLCRQLCCPSWLLMLLQLMN